MKTFDGYSKEKFSDTSVLLAGGGSKELSNFIGTLNWDSTNRKLQYKKIGDTNWRDLVTFGSNATNNTAYLPLAGGTMTGLLTTTSGGSHKGIKVGNTYINAINGDLIFQNNSAIRFGGDSWDYNVWAGLKYVHSSKIIYLGLADNSAFTANNAQSGGKLYLPGIDNIYTGNGTNIVWHKGNDGSGSGLDADLLDGIHANGLFTAFSNAGSQTTRITIGGITKDLKIDADTLDGYHASGLVKFYLSPMTSGAPADSAKNWFTNTMPSASGAIVYNVPGSEKTIIAGKSSGAYGHMLQLNYDDNYLRILRYYSGAWKTTDWEKISAGYADSAGSVAWGNVTGKPSTFTPSSHTHSYLPLSGGTMALGEGLKFHSDENYFGTNLDARIISLLDGNDTKCDGGLIIDERATYNGTTTVTELLRIRDNEFKWKGSNIWHAGNDGSGSGLDADTVDGYHASSLWRSDGATWNPGANISLNASANSQEWSFGIRRNGYTGCYWHVWDSSLSTMLKVNADNGKVYAPYNFVGNLEGNASSATTATYLNVQYCRDDDSPSNKGLWNTIKNGTTNTIANRVRFYTIYGTTTALGAPTDGCGELLEICSYNANHWQPQLWFGSGKYGRLYYRNKYYNDNTWGSWRTVAWTSDIPTVTNYYWANIKVSASSSTSTSPTFATATATTSVITPSVSSTGRLTLNATNSGLDLKFNNDDTKAVILNGTQFKPYDAANGKLDLGSTSARWKVIYGGSGNFTGDIISSVSNTTGVHHKVQNSNGAVSILASTNRGLYDETNGAWIIYLTKAADHVYIPKWASKGSSTQPVYFNGNGEPVACTAYSGLLTALSSSASTNLSITVGGTTKSVTNAYAKFGVGTYTSNGGEQRPSYIGSGLVRWNMMRNTTTYYDSKLFDGYCDWMMMDTYSGSDVPYATMIGVLKAATPHAYIASGAKGSTTGKWTIKALLDSSNYTTYTVKKDGTGASGTWGINISGNAATATNADKLDGYHETTFFRHRGSYGKSYTDASTDYVLNPGTYTTSENGFSGTLVAFNSSNSASALQFWTHYQQGNLYYRTSVDSNRWGKTDGAWTKILDSDNYTTYTVKKDGTGASGTWGINISGNAATATKSTYSSNLLGRDTEGNEYSANDRNCVFAEWNTKGDNRWYLKGNGDECRVNYATNAGNADTIDGLHASDFAIAGHTHSLGNKSASDLSSTYPSGISVGGIYNNGYPFTFGSTITASGNGGYFQIAGQWNSNVSSTSNYDFPTEMYIRGRRDSYDVWTTWSRVLTNRNYVSILDSRYYTETEADNRYLRKDTNDSTPYQYTFTKTDDHAIKVGTIRGTAVGSQTGEYIELYERVAIGSPSGWGSRPAPSYGLATYGGAWLATDTGSVGIGTTNPSEKLEVSGNIRVMNPSHDQVIARFLNWSSSPYGLMIKSYSSGAIHLQSQRESDNSEVFPLLLNPNGGNVGIGTTSPSYKLHVNGTFGVASSVKFTGLPEGSSTVTDNTEILTSWASNNGFADSNDVGGVYRRDAIHLYNYIKGKTDGIYLPLSGGTMTGAIITPGNDSVVIKPAKNNYDQIGGEGQVFYKIWATNFYGTLHGSCDGNATTATNADTVDGYHATARNNKPWGTIPAIHPSGWMDVGKQFEFHYDNTTGSDYSTALICTGNHSNIVNLPSASGTLALTSQLPTKASWNYDDVYLKLSGGTMNADARISHEDGNLYLGRADNNGWIMCQDICSQTAAGDSYWSLKTNGTFHAVTAQISGQVTATQFNGALNGNAATATKLGTADVGTINSPIYLSQGSPAKCVFKYSSVTWLNSSTGSVYVYQYGPIVIVQGKITKIGSLSANAEVFKYSDSIGAPYDDIGFTLVQHNGNDKDRNTVLYCAQTSRTFKVAKGYSTCGPSSDNPFYFTCTFITTSY